MPSLVLRFLPPPLCLSQPWMTVLCVTSRTFGVLSGGNREKYISIFPEAEPSQLLFKCIKDNTFKSHFDNQEKH